MANASEGPVRSGVLRTALVAASCCILTTVFTTAGWAGPRARMRNTSDEAVRGKTAVTIYSNVTPGAVPLDLYRPARTSFYNPRDVPRGFAVVKEDRRMIFKAGRSQVRFTDVAALIDPTTVTFRPLGGRGTIRMLEQNFQFDLVSEAKLLNRYIDHEITVEQIHGDTLEAFTGTLLGSAGGLILRTSGGRVITIGQHANVRYPSLPGGLITRPTLVWEVESDEAGPRDVRVAYQTEGALWWADYNVTFTPGEDANHGSIDIGGWVSILNRSGGSYRDARLKLVAGDAHRVRAEARRGPGLVMAELSRREGFQEKAFFEYHLYTLGRRTTLPDDSTKQIELFEAARDVPVDKEYVFVGSPQTAGRGPYTDRGWGATHPGRVDVYVRFTNSKANGLGVPLPGGRVRVSQVDPEDDALEFVGEDVIDHTPRDEEVRLNVGRAFDVVGERRQVEFNVDSSRKTMDEAIEIELRNHKDRPVIVTVREFLYRAPEWELTSVSHAYNRRDARTVEFPVAVAADGKATVRYTVHYTW